MSLFKLVKDVNFMFQNVKSYSSKIIIDHSKEELFDHSKEDLKPGSLIGSISK